MFNYQNIVNTLKKHSIVLAIKMNIIRKNYDKAGSQIKIALDKWSDDRKPLWIAMKMYHDLQDWDTFYELYEQMERFYPNNIQYKLGFGSALLSSHRYEDALRQLLFCVENWNLDISNSKSLGNTYARLAICYGYLGEWDLLEATLQKAERIVTWDLDISYGYLLLYAGTNSSERIGGFIDKQIEKHPDGHALYYWKALYTQYYLHDIQGSIRWYESALKRINYFRQRSDRWYQFFSSQQYAGPWYILKRSVEACVQSNNPNKALWLIYISKLRILYSGIDVRILRIYFDIMKNSLDAAEEKCRRMLKKNLSVSTKVEYWLLLALVQVKQGKLDNGLSSAKQALGLNSEKLEAWDILGTIQLQREAWQSAIETYQKMIKMNRFDFRCWKNLGMCYINIGDISSAKSSYEQAIQLNPFEADAWIDLANTYVRLGNNDLALSAFQTGLKYDWLDAEKRQQALQAIERMKSD